MSWYSSKDNNKSLEQLLDSQPSFEQLLQFPDFIEVLRGFQPKLLDYITQYNGIAKQIIRYITQEPAQNDTETRKYKLPYHTIMVIQTNTPCIINSFFKIDPFNQTTYFVNAFYQFLSKDRQLLPLLCGYFSQLNLILWNHRYKETVDLMYEAKQPLILLTKHCYSKAIINILMLYLNLDLTKNNGINLQRTSIKLDIIHILYEIMRNEFEGYKGRGAGSNHEIIIENIGQIIIEIIEKYYLIADGKAMLDMILTQDKVTLIMDMMMFGGQIAMSVSPMVTWLIRYYCLSSFNTEDRVDSELNRRNQERLELQPFIKIILELFPIITSTLQNTTTLTLYHSKLMEIFNCALELSSSKLRDTIRQTKYIQMLISLLFKFPQLSIIHRIIQKVFIQLFNSQKKISQDIKKYLFCQANLIQITVGQYISRKNNLQEFEDKINNMHQGYFAYLMRIIKNYSKIQTADEQINESIMKKSSLWQQFSNYILKPYQQLCYKDLSSYENCKEKEPNQYTIRYITGSIVNNQQISKKVLEQINRQQSIQQFKSSNSNRSTEDSISNNINEDKLFNVESLKMNINNEASSLQNQSTYDQPAVNATSNQSIYTKETIKKSNGQVPGQSDQPNSNNPFANKYQQFLNSKKQQVDKELKLTRTNSAQKRLSANKSRVTSPSPKKKKWDDTPQQSQQKPVSKPPVVVKQPQNPSEGKQIKKQKIGLTTIGSMRPPLIPHAKSPIIIKAASAIQTRQQIKPPQQQTIKIQKSAQIKRNSLVYQNNIENELKVVRERGLTSSQVFDKQRTQIQLFSKSAVVVTELKNVRFYRQRATKPQSSQFRKIQEKDKILLDYLGIKY